MCTNKLRVVVRAEILPKDFLQTLGNNYLCQIQSLVAINKDLSVSQGASTAAAMAMLLLKNSWYIFG